MTFQKVWLQFKKYFFKYFNPIWLFSDLVIPLGVLAVYFIVMVKFLPDGVVSQKFASQSWKYASILAVSLYGLFFAIFFLKKLKFLSFKSFADKFLVSDLILLLLPLTPIVQYILNNQDILSLKDSFSVFGFFALLSIALAFIVPFVLGIFGSSRLLMFLGLSFSFTLTNMAFLSQRFAWFGKGDLTIQLAVLGGVFFLTFLLDNFGKRKLLYFLIVASFLANSITQIFALNSTDIDGYTPVPKEEEKASFEDNPLLKEVGERQPLKTPSIYLLIYDAYQANEVMKVLGIDNSAQEDYLKEKGFKLYPQTYSIGASSLGTMGRVLNASVGLYGDRRRAVSGDGVVQHLFNNFGYETYGLFRTDYFFQGTSPTYDVSFPGSSPSSLVLISSILNGEFRFDLGEGKDKSPAKFITAKLSAFEDVTETPRFIYMHTDLPGHSQLSGKCLDDEVARYHNRLDYANIEMRRDLETLLKSDPNSIIIVASDHGSYLTKNCSRTERADIDISEINRLDIQVRFGTFLAIRWPGENFEKYDDITVLQDLFPAIFSYTFRDLKSLINKVDPITVENNFISGASVENGVIHGGVDDGEPLFLSQ